MGEKENISALNETLVDPIGIFLSWQPKSCKVFFYAGLNQMLCYSMDTDWE